MKLFAIAILGALGALLRYFIGIVAPGTIIGMPLSTLIVNIVGSFLIGVFFALHSSGQNSLWIDVLMVGFLGALTTFSSFSLENLKLLQAGQVGVAMGYVGLKICGGVFMCYVGFRLFSPT